MAQQCTGQDIVVNAQDPGQIRVEAHSHTLRDGVQAGWNDFARDVPMAQQQEKTERKWGCGDHRKLLCLQGCDAETVL